MTVVPAGPDPAVLVTGDAMAAACAAYQKACIRNQYSPLFAENIVRDVLEAAAFPIVAAWQHWEEDQHYDAIGEPCTRCGGSGTEPSPL